MIDESHLKWLYRSFGPGTHRACPAPARQPAGRARERAAERWADAHETDDGDWLRPGRVAVAPVPVRRRTHRRRGAARDSAGSREPRTAGCRGALPLALPGPLRAPLRAPAAGRPGPANRSPSPWSRTPTRRRPRSPSCCSGCPRWRGPRGAPRTVRSGCCAPRPAARSWRTSDAAGWSGPGTCCAIRLGIAEPGPHRHAQTVTSSSRGWRGLDPPPLDARPRIPWRAWARITDGGRFHPVTPGSPGVGTSDRRARGHPFEGTGRPEPGQAAVSCRRKGGRAPFGAVRCSGTAVQ